MENRPLSVGLEVYESIAEEYARVSEHKDVNEHYERPAMLSMLPSLQGLSVLDVGCGSGVYSEIFLQAGASVTAVDYCKTFVSITNTRVKGRASVHCCDISKGLPFIETGSLDIVVAPLSLDYVLDWRKLFRKFHRVLKESGSVVFSSQHPCFGRFGKPIERYFETEPQIEVWGDGFSQRIEMPRFRRSLTEMISSFTDAGFMLGQILEPLPDDAIREESPEFFERLNTAPLFICIKAIKIGAEPDGVGNAAKPRP